MKTIGTLFITALILCSFQFNAAPKDRIFGNDPRIDKTAMSPFVGKWTLVGMDGTSEDGPFNTDLSVFFEEYELRTDGTYDYRYAVGKKVEKHKWTDEWSSKWGLDENNILYISTGTYKIPLKLIDGYLIVKTDNEFRKLKKVL